MATSSAALHQGKHHRSFAVTATADGDTTLVLTTGLTLPTFADATKEVQVTIEPILQAPAAASGWAVTARDATTVTLTKGTGAGSGNASAQVRVHCRYVRGAFG